LAGAGRPAARRGVARTRLFEALARLGHALADRWPVVLFVDDVHWADAASLDVLQYVARRWAAAGTRVLVVLGVRPEALDSTPALREWLHGLRRDVALTRLALGPLSQDDAFELARRLDDPARFVRLAGQVVELAADRATLALALSQRERGRGRGGVGEDGAGA
jgi:hypothetical protein